MASVGLTEATAKEAGHKVKVGKFPFIGNGKAIALGEAEGFVKTVFDAETGELLGAHMVGAEVTELIQGYAIARQLETTEAELMETVFPHPTLERDDARERARCLWAGAALLGAVLGRRGFKKGAKKDGTVFVFAPLLLRANRPVKRELPALRGGID